MLGIKHGGKDSGAINKSFGYQEKDVALSVVLALKRELESRGLRVVTTRETDVTMDYKQRVAIENKNKCDLAVSIHLNGFSNENANGFEVWVHHNANAKTVNQANCIVEQLATTPIKKRGLRKGHPNDPQGDFWVNRLTNAPSMLVELGFITNLKDVTYIINNTKHIAYILADGICKAVDYTPKNKEPKKSKFELVVPSLDESDYKNIMSVRVANGLALEDWLRLQGYKVEKRK